MSMTHLNPETLHRNPAFTQIITVEAPAKLIYIGGQNAVNTKGEIVGDDLGSQTQQVMKNMLAALEAAGAKMENVVKITIYVVQGQALEQGFAAYSQFLDQGVNPPTISVIIVAGLANPKFLIEMEAIAAV
ncbi:RidA family protein [Anaerolineales bacterium]